MALSKILPAGQNQFAGARNLIINGAMQVWQRSISSTSTGWGYYTADRWNTNLRDGAGTMSQYDMGSELQPFIYALKTAMTSAATSNPVVQQKVEDSRRFKNQTVTFSFYAKSSKAITVDTTFDLLWANSSNATTAQSNSITTSWQRFTYTVTLPNPSGTYNSTYDHLYCRVSLPISDTYEFYITGIQLEVGDTATPFEHRSYGDELARCQRYYKEWSAAIETAGRTKNGTTTCTFAFEMRATPTATFSGTTFAYYNNTGYEITAIAAGTPQGRVATTHTSFSSTNVGAAASVYLANLKIDAEL